MKNLHLGICTLLIVATAVWAGAPAVADDTPRGHDNPDCRLCHMRTAGTAASVRHDSGACRSCHPDLFHGRAEGLGFHGPGAARRCLDCHSYHTPGTVRTTRGDLELASLKDLNLGHCQGCHEGGNLAELSEAHLAAANLYHTQAHRLRDLSPSEACLQCHSESRATDWQEQGGQVLSFSEHATHPFGMEVVAGAGSFAHRIRRQPDPTIPLFEGRIECATCHQLAGQQKDRVRTAGSPRDLCLGCHQFRDQDAPPQTAMAATLATLDR